MSYPGITFVFMISVAIGSAIYYYFNRDFRQPQNQHSGQGYENEYYEYPYVTVPKPMSPCNNKKKRKETKYEECIICLQAMNPNSTKTLNCGHIFHINCIKTWFQVDPKNSCPVCRGK